MYNVKNSLPLYFEEYSRYDTYYYEYSFLFSYITFCFVLSCLFLVLSYFFCIKQSDLEKTSVYECGFDPVDEAHKTLDVHFFVVGVLFLIFDLEIAFLYPWAAALTTVGFIGYFSMIVFIGLLTLGFAYEWCRGALDWSESYKND